MGRRLVSIRRRVEVSESEAYGRKWGEARAAVEAAGSHAWAFASSMDPADRMEFLEFAEGADPRSDPVVAAALEALESDHRGATDEWEEAG